MSKFSIYFSIFANVLESNIFIFDSSGEYYNAFNNLNQINNSFNYRFISTNEVEGIGEKLRLPIYLLNKELTSIAVWFMIMWT